MLFIKPHIRYHRQYKDMMSEWLTDGSRLAPWTLHLPYESKEDFSALVSRCEEVERGENLNGFAANTTWWLYDEKQDKLIGACNLRHWLNDSDGQLWGHVGYGIRPSERRKGYASLALLTMAKEAKALGIDELLLGAYSSNIASWKVMERCGAVFHRTILENNNDPDSEICQYTLKI